MDQNNKNNSPNGWTDLELNGRLENNSLNRWSDGELNDQHENNSLKDGESMVGTKITLPGVGQYKNNSPKGWVAQKYLAKGMEGWRVKWSARKYFAKG